MRSPRSVNLATSKSSSPNPTSIYSYHLQQFYITSTSYCNNSQDPGINQWGSESFAGIDVLVFLHNIPYLRTIDLLPHRNLLHDNIHDLMKARNIDHHCLMQFGIQARRDTLVYDAGTSPGPIYRKSYRNSRIRQYCRYAYLNKTLSS